MYTLQDLKKSKLKKEQEIDNIALQFSFTFVFWKPENCLLRYIRDGVKIDVWYSKMTVGIYEGDSQKYIKKVSMEDLVEIFANPSVTL